MPRPTLPQICTGTFTVVASAVALLAVSGSTGVFEVAVLVAFAVALGTLATALLMTLSAQRRPDHGAPSPAEPARADTAPEAAAVPGPRPEYAGRS
ncbi:hypothetical protein [Kitasatospora sp. DSM 101779]|uniref:hypothetical protein n=1 Tax=Kitasatospora sp. DSM 101779 TaxID=2853165 RepID=UPI0021DA2A32|nr:hypothetical protein [Kitasatospora sp. DSM 101779]MCU7824575.1 hypothetical protein [Kitasatospora sp. DSM 101779]